MARPVEHYGCTIDGCERKHKAHGLCAVHYNLVLIERKKPTMTKDEYFDGFWEFVKTELKIN